MNVDANHPKKHAVMDGLGIIEPHIGSETVLRRFDVYGSVPFSAAGAQAHACR
jgi:hypothetical protein